MWSSSLLSSIKGKQIIQSLDFPLINGMGDLFDVTTKPLIFDVEMGVGWNIFLFL